MEITEPLDLSEDQQSLLVMHSALNVLNVIQFEIMTLEQHYTPTSGSAALIRELHATGSSLADTATASSLTTNVEDFIEKVLRELGVWREKLAARDESLEGFDQTLENLHSIFAILRVRARELAARLDNPFVWQEFAIEPLTHNFLNVLMAIEKNSKGRYRIVYNLAEHDEGAYLVNLSITSVNRETVCMPAVFQDIMRDLLANARKYTEPGGRIEAGLYDSGSELRFVISDSGNGIPAGEISRIIQFGQRGSNASAPTRGGGFGLTKAYWYTRHFGGRFWIDSDPQSGTTIEIRTPREP